MLAGPFVLTHPPTRAQRNFDIAATMRPELDEIEDFVSVERGQSLSRPDVFLSLSYWRTEAAISAWRSQ